MYPLPPDFDVGVFEGRTLIDVHTTSNTAYFLFGDGEDVEVTSWGEVRVGTSDTDLHSACVPFPLREIEHLRGQRVSEARVFDRATIRITLAEGAILEFVEDTDQYECFEIRTASGHVIV